MQSKKKAYLIDAPGYGFATGVSKKEIDQWGKLVETYLKLTDKNNFKQKILCLMDITHGIKEVDAILFRMLDDFKKQFMIVFTKCDKMDNNDLVKGIEIA